ncbi:MAG: hypothetical protein LBG60_15220 [Bifidobacteriaceae bacterium]|nr:hypothetical protein [Bifidobacteriaceae bacterium]
MSKATPIQPGLVGATSALAGRPRLPAVDLIPSYVAKRQANRSLQIKAAVALVLLVLALGGGYVGISLWKGAAEDRLATAEAEAARLVKQKEQYAEVIQVNRDLEMTKSALMASMSYEIRWPALVEEMFRYMPEGVRLQSISLQGMSANDVIGASENVFAPPRIGTVTLSVFAPSLDAVSDWLDSFDLIPGLEDTTYYSLSADQSSLAVGEDGGFVLNASTQINLIGLTGKGALPDDFKEWLFTAQQGGEQAAGDEEAAE